MKDGHTRFVLRQTLTLGYHTAPGESQPSCEPPNDLPFQLPYPAHSQPHPAQRLPQIAEPTLTLPARTFPMRARTRRTRYGGVHGRIHGRGRHADPPLVASAHQREAGRKHDADCRRQPYAPGPSSCPPAALTCDIDIVTVDLHASQVSRERPLLRRQC